MIRTSYKYLELIKLTVFWLGLSAFIVAVVVGAGLLFVGPAHASKKPRQYQTFCPSELVLDGTKQRLYAPCKDLFFQSNT